MSEKSEFHRTILTTTTGLSDELSSYVEKEYSTNRKNLRPLSDLNWDYYNLREVYHPDPINLPYQQILNVPTFPVIKTLEVEGKILFYHSCEDGMTRYGIYEKGKNLEFKVTKDIVEILKELGFFK